MVNKFSQRLDNIHRSSSKINEENIIQTYRRYAPIYDWLFGKILHPGRKAIIEEVNNIQPTNILEIGVGTGLMLPLYPEHIPITAIDLSREMLTKAKQKIPKNRLSPIYLLEGNAESLPFESNSFSCVILPYTYSVTPKPEQLIKEVRRVCDTEGTIIILNHFSGFKSAWYGLEILTRYFSQYIGFKSDFPYSTHIENLNCEIIKSYPVNFFDLSRIVIISNNYTN